MSAGLELIESAASPLCLCESALGWLSLMLLACLLLCFGRLSKMCKQFFRKEIAIKKSKQTGVGDLAQW